jgi:hypothetical protein
MIISPVKVNLWDYAVQVFEVVLHGLRGWFFLWLSCPGLSVSPMEMEGALEVTKLGLWQSSTWPVDILW